MITMSSFHAMLIPILIGMIMLAIGFNFRDKNAGVLAMWLGMLMILATRDLQDPRQTQRINPTPLALVLTGSYTRSTSAHFEVDRLVFARLFALPCLFLICLMTLMASAPAQAVGLPGLLGSPAKPNPRRRNPLGNPWMKSSSRWRTISSAASCWLI